MNISPPTALYSSTRPTAAGPEIPHELPGTHSGHRVGPHPAGGLTGTPPYRRPPPATRTETVNDTAAPERHDGEVERFVNVSASTRLWVQETGKGGTSPLLLIMGANASGLA